MIPNQGRWLAVNLCTLLVVWGCAEGTQSRPSNPLMGASAGTGAAGNAGGATAAGAPSPRAGAGGASAAGTAGSANAGGRGGAGAGMDAGTSNPAEDGGIDEADGGLDDLPAEEWGGTTSQGLAIGFDITEAGLTRLRLQYAFPPICDGDNSTEFDPPVPLGDPFSVSFVLAGATNATFSGTFGSDGRSASGSVMFMSTLTPGQPACGVGVITWNATL
jgi:hypothetical protein